MPIEGRRYRGKVWDVTVREVTTETVHLQAQGRVVEDLIWTLNDWLLWKAVDELKEVRT